MKKLLKGYILGALTAALLAGGVSYAANTVRIVIDNRELIPTDADGNRVNPIIVDGTTYLPVRAVAKAIGKAVYWDGPNYTVYLGDMNGTLQYPTDELSIEDNIGYGWKKTTELKDNLGNIYSRAISAGNKNPYEKICNMEYSRFKGTIYVKNGSKSNDTTQIVIKADGKTIYTSSEIDKTTAPIYFDVDITGCYDLQISNTSGCSFVAIGNAGFYQ